jgi:2-oxoglutarate ferredoxin oxidoreductase subunit beta
MVRLEHGQPLRFGTDGNRGVVRDPNTGAFSVVDVAEVGADALVVHDAHADDPSYAFALSRLSGQDLRYTPIGVFRSVERPTYDEQMTAQIETAREASSADTAAELGALLRGNDTWIVA